MKKFLKNAMAYPMAQQAGSTGSSNNNNSYNNYGQQQAQNTNPSYYSASAYSHSAAPAAGGPPPPLSDLNRWFDYYDRDRSGSLDREELVNALVRTYQSNDPQSIRETVYSIFPAFDTNGSGSIDRYEFTSPGGLGESLLSAMQQIENRYPPAYTPSYGSNAAAAAGVPSSSTSSTTWVCPSCTFTNFNTKSTCGMCGTAQPVSVSTRTQQPPSSYYSTAAVATAAPQVQQPQYQIMKATIPPGMGPGQQIKVQTANGMFMVAIPDRSKWINNTFEFKVPVTTTAVVTPVATPVAPTTSYYPGPPQIQPQQQWVSFTQFQGGERYYKPPPLQLVRVPITLSPVRVSGRRRALLIGINYPGTRAALRGCVNDARNVQRLLLRHGYPNDSSHMVMLTDDTRDRNYMPTGDNIFRALQWLVQGLTPGDVLFFHYSGHGAQVKDKTGMELDGMNETILPSDYNRRQITDDELWGSIVYPLPNGVRLTAIMDCCHSGTGLDLPFDYNITSGGGKHGNGKRHGLLNSFLDMSVYDSGGPVQGRWVADPNPAHSQGDVVLFSGCQDSQTSADTMDKYQAGGAMTQSFISAYEENPGATYAELLALIHKSLRRRNFSQRPQLTSSQTFDVQSRRFSFTEGIEPNHNEMIGRTKTHHFKPGRPGGGLNDLFGGNLGTVAAVAIGASLLSDLF